jgi:dTDP-4-amino-4,6-dideoxygalactose transaminase
MAEDAFIPYSRPFVNEGDISAVGEVLRSGWWTTGPQVREFEERFADYCGARYAVAVNSCTAGLHVALAALDVAQGDCVVVPTYTFAATAEVATYMGAIPVLLDIEPGTLNIDPAQIEALLTALAEERPGDALRRAIADGCLPEGVARYAAGGAQAGQARALVPVHFAGQACDMDPIMSSAAQHGVPIVEDAAHAVESTYKGRKIGSIGAATTFSFYATKNLSTGEGGMVVTDDEVLADRMRRLSLHGISRDAWKRYTATGTWRYDIVEPGFKYNLTDVAACLGLRQLDRIGEMRARRLEIVQAYSGALDGIDGVSLPAHLTEGEHAWHLYVVRIDPGASGTTRDVLIDALRARGIGTSVHFIPLHMHSYYRQRFGFELGDYPVAEAAFEGVLSLPLYPSLSDDEVARVIRAFRECIPSASSRC